VLSAQGIQVHVVKVYTDISGGAEEEGLFTTFPGSWSGMNMSENKTF
jgi:hypothetical protein